MTQVDMTATAGFIQIIQYFPVAAYPFLNIGIAGRNHFQAFNNGIDKIMVEFTRYFFSLCLCFFGEYQAQFIQHYIAPVVYPSGMSRPVELIASFSVLIWNVLVYTLVVSLRRRGPLRAATKRANRGRR
jgi:hypothetical protein